VYCISRIVFFCFLLLRIILFNFFLIDSLNSRQYAYRQLCLVHFYIVVYLDWISQNITIGNNNIFYYIYSAVLRWRASSHTSIFTTIRRFTLIYKVIYYCGGSMKTIPYVVRQFVYTSRIIFIWSLITGMRRENRRLSNRKNNCTRIKNITAVRG